MNTLMHICCAPCANRPIAQLREEGIQVAGFWFNPNIHPYTEYQARKHTLEDYAKEIGMKLIIGGSYDLRSFITAVAGDIDGRCAYCYRVRMEETARVAERQGFDEFATTLSVSPHKNTGRINAVGYELEKNVSASFLDESFKKRDGFRRSVELSKEYGIYRQNYCGCVFSKRD